MREKEREEEDNMQGRMSGNLDVADSLKEGKAKVGPSSPALQSQLRLNRGMHAKEIRKVKYNTIIQRRVA